MTKDEIIEMARLFLWGGNVVEGWTFHSYEQLESFAKLVAEKEREACAKVADGWPDYDVQGLAEAIRARGDEA
jgi:ribosomal 50S subunit-associated protein YjgA (DUF615 family)